MSVTELGPWLGRCHFIREGVRHEVLAAVLCRSHQEFDTILTDVLTAQHIEFLWSEEVHPAGPWVHVRPGRGGAELARTLHEGHRVAFGPVKTLKEAEAPPKDHLHITEITGIIPLAFEVGSWSERTVPEALEEPLFGRLESTEAERAVYGDAPLKTYAILDAAKMPYLLTSFLAGSGLRHQSLFQGKTQEDLKEHAPYLVELEQENDLTKRLFTGPKGINGLWEKELGIFMRSRMGFDEVRKHFRKFTRIQDETEKWFYFRFWEPETLLALLDDQPDDLPPDSLLRLGAGVQLVVLSGRGDRFLLADGLVINAKDNTKPMLSQADRASFQRMQWKRFALKVAAALRDEQQMIANDQALALCDRAAYYGFTRENAIYKVVRALYIDQDKIETEICKQTITKDNEENIADQLEKLCERI